MLGGHKMLHREAPVHSRRFRFAECITCKWRHMCYGRPWTLSEYLYLIEFAIVNLYLILCYVHVYKNSASYLVK